MQLKNSTDYAIRIVCYLAAQERMISTSELSRKLNVSANYVPKIAKKLKNAKIVTACEGTNGGYMLAKQPENISLMDIISCVEETMAINRCLEEDCFCSRNLEDTCKIHKILLSLQNTYNNKLESVKVSDVIRPGEDEYFGRFYVVLKLNLKEKSYECVYSHIREVYEKVRKTKSYEEFINQYIERYVYASDKKMVHDFLSIEGLEEKLVDGCMEKDLPYRRTTGKDKNAYVWMEAKKYIDANENTAIITLHNEKIVQNTVIRMEQELVKKEQDMAKLYWDMVSLLTTVLNHNHLVEVGYQDDISFYTKQVYLQLQNKYPEYGITDEEMNVVKQHPLVGAAMTQRFPEGVTTEKLNQYSYEICRHHHERYDGSGYPDGLKGNAIPMCAQVVGIVDAYDALINDRPYKRKYEPEEAIRMISNGECGVFSNQLMQCFQEAAKQQNWLKRQN
jgi:putative two-component system response regulator